MSGVHPSEVQDEKQQEEPPRPSGRMPRRTGSGLRVCLMYRREPREVGLGSGTASGAELPGLQVRGLGGL